MEDDEIRLIIASKDNGENETVIFTDDDKAPATDFLLPGQNLDHDEIIEDNLPTAFPRCFTLHRE